jgi:hypothetical protein
LGGDCTFFLFIGGGNQWLNFHLKIFEKAAGWAFPPVAPRLSFDCGGGGM